MEAVRRGSPGLALDELQKALDDWTAATRPMKADGPLQEIKGAVALLGTDQVQIGRMSCSTAHEAAWHRTGPSKIA